MLKKFSEKFNVASKNKLNEDKSFFKDLPSDLVKLFDSYSGYSVENGLYRIHSFNSSLKWSLMIAEYFEKYQFKIYPFGFDWMGRQFCLANTQNSVIYMFDPATGEDYVLHQNIVSFHEDDLVGDTNDMLASNLFKSVLKYCKLDALGYSECLGYKTPLFLGGKDEIKNYEKADLEVYWTWLGQLFKKVKDLPDGANIGQIRIE
jgi:hypothetical protein